MHNHRVNRVALVLLSLSFSAEAHALVVPYGPEYVPSGAGADGGVPSSLEPVAPTFSEVTLRRGQGLRRADCSGTWTSSSWDGWAGLNVYPERVEDALGPLGFRFSFQEGALPEALQLPEFPLAISSDGSVSLAWGDDAVDEQEPLDFTLEVRAVNAAGNESEATLLHVEHDGAPDFSDGAKCDYSGECAFVWRRRDPAPFALLGVIVSLGVWRRTSTSLSRPTASRSRSGSRR